MQDVNDAVSDLLNDLRIEHGITVPKFNKTQLDSEVPHIWKNEKFMSLDLKKLSEKSDERSKGCIQAHINNIRNKWNHRFDNLEPAAALLGNDITNKLKPIMTVISDSGLIQKIIDTYTLVLQKYPNPNEAILAFLVDVVNSQELKDAIFKIDIEKHLASFNILDLLMLTQKMKLPSCK